MLSAMLIILSLSHPTQASNHKSANRHKATHPKKHHSATINERNTQNGWFKVAKYTGSGTKNTRPFKVGRRWVVAWYTEGAGNFAITIHKLTGETVDMAANVVGKSEDESYQYQPGTYYLEISADQSYEVNVADYRGSGTKL